MKQYTKTFISLISQLRPIEFYGLTIHMHLAAAENFSDTLDLILDAFEKRPRREKKELIKLLRKTIKERPDLDEGEANATDT